MYVIHRKAPIILGWGTVYPVYNVRTSSDNPAIVCAGAGVLNAAVRARNQAFMVIVIVKTNKKKILLKNIRNISYEE
jgi:hypothetical protein